MAGQPYITRSDDQPAFEPELELAGASTEPLDRKGREAFFLLPPAEFRIQACFAGGMRQLGNSRKLLIASVGVATINYVAACGREPVTSGNLVAPPPPSIAGAPANAEDAGVVIASGAGGAATIPPTSGNLVAPPASAPAPTNTPPTSGNLMPP